MSAIDDVIQETAAVVDAAVNSVNLTVLQPEGLRLFGMLAGLAFILAGYKVFVRDEGSHKLFVQLAWTSFLIFLLSWFVGDGYLFIFDESINQSFNRIADKLLPGSSNGSAWTAAMSIMWDALQKRGCKNFCVNGHLAGNCRYPVRSRNDRTTQSTTHRAD